MRQSTFPGIPPHVRTIFFDYGDTLSYMSPNPMQVWVHLAKELQLQLDAEALQRAMEEAEIQLAPQLTAYHGRMHEYWSRYDAFILDRLGIADPRGTLHEAIHTGFNRPEWYHAFPETHEVLQRLKELGYELGIISNNVDEIMQRIDQLDLKQYFDTITYSQEVGAEKPNPHIFRVALLRAGRTAEEALHVGDNYEADVRGAIQAGITPVLVDRDSRYPDAACWTIPSLLNLAGPRPQQPPQTPRSHQ